MKTIFNDLRNIKEIDNWSFNEEELSDLQTNFTVFWEKLPTYYNRLNDKLTELEKGYSGKLYKWVATSIYEVLDDYEPKTVYFAGFNALSTSEELIIETFVNSGKGQLMLDGDEFYIDNPDHEAGHFLRQQIAKKGRKSLKWIDSYFPKNEKKIDILSSLGIPRAGLEGLLSTYKIPFVSHRSTLSEDVPFDFCAWCLCCIPRRVDSDSRNNSMIKFKKDVFIILDQTLE